MCAPGRDIPALFIDLTLFQVEITLSSMTAGEALRDARGYAMANRITRTDHGKRRGGERNATYHDIRSALMSATSAKWQPDKGTWLIAGGIDTDGDALDCAVVFDDGVVVVTIY